ncbi:MAG: hypothetical protein IJF27_08035 [Oscillospiraceae bacterium]|nr:hypothetical protein [Oscillospiraceae bacterium]
MSKKCFLRILCAAVTVCVMLTMSGCGILSNLKNIGQQEIKPEQSGSDLQDKLDKLFEKQEELQEGKDQEDKDQEDKDPSYLSLISELENNGMDCAVAFVGYVDGPMGDGYRGFFEERGYLEDYAFMADIPYDNYVETYGNEFYCIIPADPNASVAVNEWIVPNGVMEDGYAGEVLYRSESGEPITILCNEEAIYSNVQVNIVDSDGNVITIYPMLDVMDGYLITGGDNRGNVEDITVYGAEENEYFVKGMVVKPEELAGDWEAIVETEDGDRMVCRLYFVIEDSYTMAYWYGPENSEIFEAFEGYFYNSNGAGNAANPERIMFDMMLVDGSVLESIEPYSFGGEFIITWADSTGERINVLHTDGYPLLYACEYTEIEFSRCGY